jgi:hypothetical protein
VEVAASIDIASDRSCLHVLISLQAVHCHSRPVDHRARQTILETAPSRRRRSLPFRPRLHIFLASQDRRLFLPALHHQSRRQDHRTRSTRSGPARLASMVEREQARVEQLWLDLGSDGRRGDHHLHARERLDVPGPDGSGRGDQRRRSRRRYRPERRVEGKSPIDHVFEESRSRSLPRHDVSPSLPSSAWIHSVVLFQRTSLALASRSRD